MLTRSQARRKRNVRITGKGMSLFDPDHFMTHLLQVVVDFDYTTKPDHPAIKSLAAGGYNYASDLFNLIDQEVVRLRYQTFLKCLTLPTSQRHLRNVTSLMQSNSTCMPYSFKYYSRTKARRSYDNIKRTLMPRKSTGPLSNSTVNPCVLN
jgi:hypothetical protein